MKIVSGSESADVRLEGDRAIIDGRDVSFRVQEIAGRLEALEIDGKLFRLRVTRQGERLLVWCVGRAFGLERVTGTRPREAEGDLRAPMPGRVRRILVSVGQRVARGGTLLVLEAMKMEHAIRSPRDGIVGALAHREGDLVEAGEKLAEIRD